jgi:hypothetical protein
MFNVHFRDARVMSLDAAAEFSKLMRQVNA